MKAILGLALVLIGGASLWSLTDWGVTLSVFAVVIGYRMGDSADDALRRRHAAHVQHFMPKDEN